MEDGSDETNCKDYYKILEVDYDATDEIIRLHYRRLALKWHPDKHKGDNAVTARFQEINEAYRVLSDPAQRFDYDLTGIYEIHKYTLSEYLTRFKGMILTCNGLGISQTSRLSLGDVMQETAICGNLGTPAQMNKWKVEGDEDRIRVFSLAAHNI